MHAVRNVSRVLTVTADEGEHEAAPNATSGSGVVRDRPRMTPTIGIVRLAVRTPVSNDDACPVLKAKPSHRPVSLPQV
jgi:hypothetical protein